MTEDATGQKSWEKGGWNAGQPDQQVQALDSPFTLTVMSGKQHRSFCVLSPAPLPFIWQKLPTQGQTGPCPSFSWSEKLGFGSVWKEGETGAGQGRAGLAGTAPSCCAGPKDFIKEEWVSNYH